MPGVWHVFCFLPYVATCIGHVWHREAVALWTRRSYCVVLTECCHNIVRSNLMATYARETVGLIGSDKVEGTNVYDAPG
jgi:hypothetical protein